MFVGRQLLVLLPATLNSLLGLAQQKLRHFRIALLQHSIATFSVDVIFQRNLRIARIKLERDSCFQQPAQARNDKAANDPDSTASFC